MALEQAEIEFVKKYIDPAYEPTDDDTEETVKTRMGDLYVGKDLHTKEINAAVGRKVGGAEVAFKRILGDEAKDLQFADMVKKVEERISTITTELKKLQDSSDPNQKKQAELEKKVSDLQALLDASNEKVTQLTGEVESARAEGETKLQQHLLTEAVNAAFSKANWTDDSDDIVKKGVWSALIDGKYTFKKEGDKLYVYDPQGEMIKDGTAQKTAEKLFEEILKTAKRFKLNNAKDTKPIGTGDDGKVRPTVTKAAEKARANIAGMQQ